jgi:glycosyltransferase involved in cell wall biosynthesis
MQNFIGFSVPTYNEEKNISIFLESIINNFDNNLLEICIVDDESKDRTVNIVREYSSKYSFVHLIQRKKLSKRTQVYTAYHAGLNFLIKKDKIKYFCQIDSDNMVDIESIKKAFAHLINDQHVDVVKLSKYHSDSVIDRSLIRRFYSFIYSFICKIFYKTNIKDFSTGIRFYNRKSIEFISTYEKKFPSPIGLLDDLLILINNNFTISENPFVLTDRKFGKSFISLKESILCLLELILCIIKNLKRKYKKI